MGLQVGALQDADHARSADILVRMGLHNGLLEHVERPGSTVLKAVVRGPIAGHRHQLAPNHLTDPALLSGAVPVVQPLQSMAEEAVAPEPDRVPLDAQPAGHPADTVVFGQHEDDARPERDCGVDTLLSARELLEAGAHPRSKRSNGSWSRARSSPRRERPGSTFPRLSLSLGRTVTIRALFWFKGGNDQRGVGGGDIDEPESTPRPWRFQRPHDLDRGCRKAH